MQNKLRAAKNSLIHKETILMARTDARSTESSLSAAIARGQAYIEAGADAIFVEAPRTVSELKEIGRSLPNTILLANMMEGGKTPLLTQSTLEEFGFALIAYPITGILSLTKAVQESLTHLKKHGTTKNWYKAHMQDFSEFREFIGL